MCSDTQISKNKYLIGNFSFSDTFSSKFVQISLHNVIKKYLREDFSAIDPLCQPKASGKMQARNFYFLENVNET